jgi:hypothetical protein
LKNNPMIGAAWQWVHAPLEVRGFSPPQRIEGGGEIGWRQDCPQDKSLAALCRRAGSTLAISLALDEALVVDGVVRELIENCLARSASQFEEDSRQWWRSFSAATPRIAVPDRFLQKFYDYALYKFGGATNPHGPACALQGPWLEEYQMPPWSGDYHFNVNIQQIYTLAPATNHAAHLLPLFDMVDSWRGVMQRHARVLCGIGDGLALPHATDDRGHACGGQSAGAMMDHACAAWLAQLYWLYYTYSGDESFLRERALPFLRGVMRVYEAMLDDDGAQLHLPIGISAEYGVPRGGELRQCVGRDASYQLACIHMLADALLEACRVLRLPPREQWRDIKKRLPLHSSVGRGGDERIAVWEGQDLEESHRHHSHLAAIYPFDTLGATTPEKETVIENSLRHCLEIGAADWSEWGIPWAAILLARRGDGTGVLRWLQLWRETFVNEGLATVYIPRATKVIRHRAAWRSAPHPWSPLQAGDDDLFERQEIMQLDGTMAAATALLEMLLHTRGGQTHVFPAIPTSWREVSFENIRAPGAFLLSGEWRNGQAATVKIHSLGDGEIQLHVTG